MAINPIQLQKGLSLAEFMRRYGTEAQCEAALAALRWPEGLLVMDDGRRIVTRPEGWA